MTHKPSKKWFGAYEWSSFESRLKPDAYETMDILNTEMLPFFCEKIKEHEDTIDEDWPRDYLGGFSN